VLEGGGIYRLHGGEGVLKEADGGGVIAC